MIITNTFIPGKHWLDPDVYQSEVFELHEGIEYDAVRKVSKWLPRPLPLQHLIYFELECECLRDIQNQINMTIHKNELFKQALAKVPKANDNASTN